jgi:hypothetical protein
MAQGFMRHTAGPEYTPSQRASTPKPRSTCSPRRRWRNDIDDLAQIWVRPALSDPAVAEDLRQLTRSFRTEVTTNVAARLPEFDEPALIARSADDVFFELGDGERLAATIPKARLEVIESARTFLDGGPAGPARRPDLDDRRARLAG